MDDIKVIDQNARLLTDPEVIDSTFLDILTYAGRTCTGLENKESDTDDKMGFVERIMKNQHFSVLEHCSVTLELVTNRAITHQIVRHRIAAYSQQSMRFVKFTTKNGKEKFAMIRPYNYDNWTSMAKTCWANSVNNSADTYKILLAENIPAEDARGVLPQDTATKLIVTWNLRQLLHVFYDAKCGRMTNKHAQRQIRELMRKLYTDMHRSSFLKWLFETYESIIKV